MNFIAPQPPWHKVMPQTTQTVLIALMTAIAVVAIAALLTSAQRKRDLIPVFALIGAALGILYEPLGDSLVMAFYPGVKQHTWISAFGRDIPLFIGVLYFWYMAPFVVVFTRYAHKGFTARQWWTLWIGALCFCAGFEMFWMAMNQPWLYYGHQSLVVAGLPIWVPFTYVSFLFTMSAGVYAIATKLPRKHHWLIVLAMPCLLAAGHAATSVPAAAALYSTHNHTVILLGAVGSITLAILLAWTLSLFFQTPADALVAPTATTRKNAHPDPRIPVGARTP